MKNCDLLVTWIKHCDYPVFRQFLKKYANNFNHVYIYWSEHNRFPYFDHFIQSAISGSNISHLDPIDTDHGTQDWRNVSTNYMLQQSQSEWVCSIEQDYLCRDWEKLLSVAELSMNGYEIFGAKETAGYDNKPYVHPAFWFMKREALEKTGKNFGANSDWDHFGIITRDALTTGMRVKYLDELGFNQAVDSEADCFHLGGINQNYLQGLKKGHVFHRPEIFSAYNYWNQNVDVPQSEAFSYLCEQIAAKLPAPDFKWFKFFDSLL